MTSDLNGTGKGRIILPFPAEGNYREDATTENLNNLSGDMQILLSIYLDINDDKSIGGYSLEIRKACKVPTSEEMTAAIMCHVLTDAAYEIEHNRPKEEKTNAIIIPTDDD